MKYSSISLRLPFSLRVKGAPPPPRRCPKGGIHRGPAKSNTKARGRGLDIEDELAVGTKTAAVARSSIPQDTLYWKIVLIVMYILAKFDPADASCQ